MERTLVVLKPDTVQRRLMGEIIGRFERRGLKIAAVRLLKVSQGQAEEMYSVHKGKDFYQPLVEFITSSPVLAMVIEGLDAIAVVRTMMGPTFGLGAPSGSIRGDFGVSKRYNLIHGSDSPESAGREIPIFFRDEDILQYSLAEEPWVYSAIDK